MRLPDRARFAAVVGCVGVLWAGRPAAAGLITFDSTTGGAALNRSSVFGESVVLTETFAAWGVHFSGPVSGYGGYVLNGTPGNFGVQPASGTNFLAFNADAVNTAKGPETIKFDDPYTQVSIKVAGGNDSEPFRLDAYDATGKLVATSSVTTRSFQTLTVSAKEIRKVIVTNTSPSPNYYVYDDLSFTTTPEPAGTLLVAALAYLAGRRRGRRDAAEPSS